MSTDTEKEASFSYKMVDYIKWFFWSRKPADANSVYEFLYIHRWNKRFKYVKRVLLPALIVAVLLGLGIPYWRSGRESISIFVFLLFALSIGLIVSSLRFLYPSFNLYDKYQEIKCPKCNEYIPLYIWQCPNCDTTYKNTHIFLDCNECGAKVGRLHKNIQSIICQNENCKYEINFTEPYEGGFNKSSFRGE